MQALELIKIFIRPLERAEIPYFVTGSVASIIYGDPRLTHDIDVVIHLTADEAQKLTQYFPENDYYCPPEEIIHIELSRKDFAHLNLIHHASGFKADLYPDNGDTLYEWAFKNKRRIEIAPDLQIWIAPPEYVVIRKLEYYREGGSQKHLDDIRKMIAVSGSILNRPFLEKELERRQLMKFWKE